VKFGTTGTNDYLEGREKKKKKTTKSRCAWRRYDPCYPCAGAWCSCHKGE